MHDFGALNLAEQTNTSRLWLTMAIFLALGVPAIVLGAPELLGITGPHVESPLIAVLIFGIGIIAGAFLLSWAAEVAQMDVSASLAIAVLALIAILPEYVIEFVLAREAGASFNLVTYEVTDEISRVAANVTGANRLLIGLGWSAVILIYWIKRRRALDMRGELGLEITMLTIATLVTLLIFFMQQVHFILAIGLIGLYVVYLWISSTKEAEEPDLIGAAALIGTQPTARRRAIVIFLFVYSAVVIIMAAEPFVHGLIETGTDFGIDEFTLIQWVAPLASESPEIIVAVLFSLRANPIAGLTALISSEVNQLTLLIGSMVIVFSGAAGDSLMTPLNFPLDWRQSVEFLLTTSVSLFGLLLIAKRVIPWWAGAILLALFIAHLPFLDPAFRLGFAGAYFALSILLVAVDWRRVKFLFREEPQELKA